MRVVTEMQHQVLAFIDACNASGYEPTSEEIEAWLEDSPSGPSALTRMATNGWRLSAFQAIGYGMEYYSMGERFEKMSWAYSVHGGLVLSALGRALLQSAERSDAEEPSSATVVLGADDDLAYATLMADLAKARAGLLIDPYLRREHVFQLVQDTSLTRILTSTKIDHPGKTAKVDELRAFVANIPVSRGVEVRLADEAHDRYLKAEDGNVFMIGSSLNFVQSGKATTVIVPIADLGASVVSDMLEAEWEKAAPLLTPQGAEEGGKGEEPTTSG